MASTESVGKALRSPAIVSRRTLAPIIAAFLGLILLYGVGFAQSDVVHNGAHDTRHSAALPCH